MSYNWIKIQKICEQYCIDEDEYFEQLQFEAERKYEIQKEEKE